MHSFHGAISKFLHDPAGVLAGFQMDSGLEVRFAEDRAHLVTEILEVGSRVEIAGELRNDSLGDQFLHVVRFTNLDSQRTASLPALVCLGKPGMLSVATPKTATSLAHPAFKVISKSEVDSPREGQEARLIDQLLEKIASWPHPSVDPLAEDPLRHNPSLGLATKHDAATDLEHAYDSLHRTQAILAYLHIMHRQVHGISQFHDEAKHTYQQALSWFEADEFESAREFSAASCCLSKIVEIVISRTLRADSTYPSVVPPPPQHTSTGDDSARLKEEMSRVEMLLSRLRWLLENGTLPLDDRTQVRRIVSWGEAFHEQARRMYRAGSIEAADELALAAGAAAHSAEHICRKWYVAQAIHPRPVAVGSSPQP